MHSNFVQPERDFRSTFSKTRGTRTSYQILTTFERGQTPSIVRLFVGSRRLGSDEMEAKKKI